MDTPAGPVRTESDLIEALRSPAAYDHPVRDVVLITTHASIVFLAGAYVYKIKKAVDLGFLDYSTLERRRQMCDAEVRLNTRLAPEVYLGVVPVVPRGDGLAFFGDGAPVEYAVKMRRRDDAHRLDALLRAGKVSPAQLDALADRLAEFHRSARRGPEVDAMSRPEIIEANCEDNFPSLRAAVGEVLSRRVYRRLVRSTRRELSQVHDRMQRRCAAGKACETHGDLRLEHVYAQMEHGVFRGWEVVDGVEFSERYRFGDPISDIAFLVMDLRAHGFAATAACFESRYFEASGDEDGRPLLRLYVAYRAAVRAKVRALQAADGNATPRQRAAAGQAARGHALQTLAELSEPSERPCVVLMCGLPGTGKSVLARGLARAAGFSVVRADVVRKELAGLAATDSAESSPGQGIYAPEWTRRTYAACQQQAERVLFDGGRVIVDATFRDDETRAQFVAAAQRWFVPVVIVHCVTERGIVHERLDTRVDDASDADWSVYVHMETVWEDFGATTRGHVMTVATDGAPADVVDSALAGLRQRGLVGSGDPGMQSVA
ncbi:MAG: AAA family ATPase [Myxococcota bacterium]